MVRETGGYFSKAEGYRGHIEASSGSFHGRLEGLEGYFKGTLCVGSRWNVDGSINNSNAVGFYVPSTGNSSNFFVKSSTMLVEDSFSIGGSSTGFAFFQNAKKFHIGRTHTLIEYGTGRIRGNFTLSQLNTEIWNMIQETNQGYEIPISGSIARLDYEDNPATVYILSSMEYRSNGIYRLYGMTTGGWSGYIDCTGSDKVSVNFVFV